MLVKDGLSNGSWRKRVSDEYEWGTFPLFENHLLPVDGDTSKKSCKVKLDISIKLLN